MYSGIAGRVTCNNWKGWWNYLILGIKLSHTTWAKSWKMSKNMFPGRDANPGIREYSESVIPTWPLSLVASVPKKAFKMCRLLRTGTKFPLLICTCVHLTERGTLIGHYMNMTTFIKKLLFHSVTWTAPLQNETPCSVQLTVFCRTPVRHTALTLWMNSNTNYTGRDLFAVIKHQWNTSPVNSYCLGIIIKWSSEIQSAV